MREIDKMASDAQNNPQKTGDFIARYESFIIKTASRVSKRYISKSDDEWSIALAAFSEAINKYDYNCGSFIPFAELLIKRNLIDYYRSKEKYKVEIQTDWITEDMAPVYYEDDLKLEIESVSSVLNEYGFSFMDLTDQSPKAGKTKVSCARAVISILDSPVLINEMKSSKRLPLKVIGNITGIPRKILERHRKYIIAAVEILHGDYPYLAEYLRFIREVEK